jgi:histone H3/H4
MLIVVSKAKQYAKETHEMRLSADTLERLDEVVKALIDDAAEQAKEKKMGTVKGRHVKEV